MRRSRTLPADPASVGAARRFAVQVLSGVPPAALESIALMVSELATNSVKYAQTEFELSITHSAHNVRVEVHDDAGGDPIMRKPAPTEPSGRGLQIVNLLADNWGVNTQKGGAGKTVWLTISV